ncbi:Small subunit (SSU) processome component [Xylographa trunciseda]|nr:Small subunit (SSU) processome component [Xylographa trunciseda]
MVSKKAAGQAASKTSSNAAPATSSSRKSATNSSILHSAFSPSRFQLSLFASVIQGFDSQQLRIHDTTTGRLNCSEAPKGPKTRINCLEWGRYGSADQKHLQESLSKKRKRLDKFNGSSEHHQIVVAVGTSLGDIQIFSPAEGQFVKILTDQHAQGIRDFKFVDDGLSSQGWSLGDDSKLVQWNLKTGIAIKSIVAPTTSIRTILPLPPSILCASHTAYLIDTNTSTKPTTFTVSNNPVHTLIAAPSENPIPPSFLAAAESDRYIHVLDTTSGKILDSLIASGDVKALAFTESTSHDENDLPKRAILAAVTEQGELSFFPSPFSFQDSSKSKESASLKPTRGNRTRTAVATVKMKTTGKAASAIPILGASFEESEVVIVWAEGGMSLRFERLTWQDHRSGEIVLEGVIEITKAKSSAGLGVTSMNGVKEMGRSHVDESHALVAKGGDTDDAMVVDEEPDIIDISSAEEDSESEEESDEDHRRLPEPRSPSNELVNGEATTNGDVHMEDARDEIVADSEEAEEPTFGDLLRASAPGVVDVSAAFPDPARQALAAVKDGAVKLPSGISLGTVLTQSLRTNDVSLLETCFHVQNLDIVRATIERLDSALASSLLQKLAERLHSRPGRAGSLMVWIQWTLVAHGGYLASQPEVVKKLTSLHRVVKERANSLQPLLSLKGKLDMLEAQINLRKSMQSRFGIRETDDEDDEAGVIYVEGQEESSSDDEGQAEILAGGPARSKITIRREESSDMDDASSETSENLDDTPPNMEDGSTGSDDSADESEADGFIDDEASESNDDEGFEDEVDHDDVDSAEEDEESEMEAPKPKAVKAKLSNGLTSRR